MTQMILKIQFKITNQWNNSTWIMKNEFLKINKQLNDCPIW